MQILFVNQFYPEDPAPTGQFVADLAMELANREHNVRIICSRQGYQEIKPAKKNISGSAEVKYERNQNKTKASMHNTVRVHRVAAFGFGRSTRVGRVLDYASFFLTALWTALTGPRPDVVVCLTTPPYIGLVGLILGWLRGVHSVQWVMDLYPDAMVAHGMLREHSLINRLLRWLTACILRRADSVWALGPCMKTKIECYLADAETYGKIEVIPLWAGGRRTPGDRVAPQGVAALRAAYGLNGCMTVMYSGNMGLGHDFDTLLDAMEPMNRPKSKEVDKAESGGMEGVEMLFVGDGMRADEVRAKVRERGINHIFFHPYAPAECLSESLAVGDVHIVSQLPAWQGIIVPSKLAGIMAAGRPVIFVGGEENEIAYWIRKADAGYVVPPGDVMKMRQALETLKNDPRLRAKMGQNALNFYRRELAPEINLPRLLESIRALTRV